MGIIILSLSIYFLLMTILYYIDTKIRIVCKFNINETFEGSYLNHMLYLAHEHKEIYGKWSEHKTFPINPLLAYIPFFTVYYIINGIIVLINNSK